MSTRQRILVLSATALVTACAGGPGRMPSMAAKADEHAAHRAGATTTAPAAMEMPMKSMHEMRDKMTKAKTPEERQALMADHMKAMQDGMQAMKGMAGMGMGDAKGTPAEEASHHHMMEGRMDMMQTMMEMMMQRMPNPTTAAPK